MKAKQSMMSCLIVLAVAQMLVSCVYKMNVFDNDSPIVTQIRPLKGFEKIEINGSPKVSYTQADSFSVRVTGPENVVKDILTNVDNHTLTIRNRGKIGIVNISINNVSQATVYVTSPDLVSLSLNGSGDFISKGCVDSDDMSILLRGSGGIDFREIICDHSTVDLVGSGDLNIGRLEAKTSVASLIGSGDIDIRHTNVLETNLSLKGSGDISVNFQDGCQNVNCRLAGSGDITLKGKVGQFDMKKSGSGDIDTEHLSIGR